MKFKKEDWLVWLMGVVCLAGVLGAGYYAVTFESDAERWQKSREANAKYDRESNERRQKRERLNDDIKHAKRMLDYAKTESDKVERKHKLEKLLREKDQLDR